MKALSTLAIAATLVFGGTSLGAAQDRPAPADEPVTEHTFDDPDEVLGDTVGPWGDIMAGRRAVYTGNLIQLRSHFRPELLKTVENL